MEKTMIIKGRALLAAAAALGLAFGAASPVAAQSDGARTPASWSYEIRNGQRVPKVERVTHADGSWSETMKQGNCTVTRTGRSGEVREVRKCD